MWTFTFQDHASRKIEQSNRVKFTIFYCAWNIHERKVPLLLIINFIIHEICSWEKSNFLYTDVNRKCSFRWKEFARYSRVLVVTEFDVNGIRCITRRAVSISKVVYARHLVVKWTQCSSVNVWSFVLLSSALPPLIILLLLDHICPRRKVTFNFKRNSR